MPPLVCPGDFVVSDRVSPSKKCYMQREKDKAKGEYGSFESILVKKTLLFLQSRWVRPRGEILEQGHPSDIFQPPVFLRKSGGSIPLISPFFWWMGGIWPQNSKGPCFFFSEPLS